MRLDSDNIRNLPVTGLWRAVLIVAVLVLNSGLGVQAQTATPRHSSRIARRLALADSLRLEMRKAADEGRLLQWGDSILRAKMNREKSTLQNLSDCTVACKRLTAGSIMAINCCKRGISVLTSTHSI